MNRFIFTLLLCLFAVPSFGENNQSKSSSDELKSTNIYVNPLGLALGAANLAAEFGVAPRITVGLGLSYASVTSGTAKATAFGVGARSTFFLTNDRFDWHDSWYVAPFFDYASASNSTTSAKASGIGFGANVGYWWFFENGFNISLGFGAQYFSIDYTSIGLASVSAVFPSAAFNLGFAF